MPSRSSTTGRAVNVRVAMKSRLAIRDVAAERGTAARGFLTIGETVSSTVRVPLVIVNGAEDGPVLCLTAGVHATEYAPIDAVMRMVRTLDPVTLRGAVVAVPVANPRMFESRTPFVSPLDGLNLNKVGAGRRDGSPSEVLAHVLLEEVIATAQVHIDLHGGDFGEMLLPFVGYAVTGRDDVDAMSDALARLYSPNVVSPGRVGGRVPPFGDGIVAAAAQRGVVSLFAEAGGNGTLDEGDVRIHLDGIARVMRYLKMIDGDVERPGARLIARDRTVVRATRAGLLRLKVAVGDEIAIGQEVAEIVDVFGETVERVCARGSGIAGLVWAHKVVATGDPVVRYWIGDVA